MPYAIHKSESDEVVRYRADSMEDCRIYHPAAAHLRRRHHQNYMVGVLRGTAQGKSKRAARMQAEGKRLPLMLPRDTGYLGKKLQFVHVDDMARLLTYLLYRPDTDPPVTILNVTGRGEPLTFERCAEIAHAN